MGGAITKLVVLGFISKQQPSLASESSLPPGSYLVLTPRMLNSNMEPNKASPPQATFDHEFVTLRPNHLLIFWFPEDHPGCAYNRAPGPHLCLPSSSLLSLRLILLLK